MREIVFLTLGRCHGFWRVQRDGLAGSWPVLITDGEFHPDDRIFNHGMFEIDLFVLNRCLC